MTLLFLWGKNIDLGASMTQITFVNDTSAWYHWGCTCTSTAILDELARRDITTQSIPANEIYHCRERPKRLTDFESPVFFFQFRTANPNIIEALEAADVVVINGEGTLHGMGSAACILLYLAYVAKTRLDKPVHLINHSFFPGNSIHDIDPVASTLYKNVYDAMDFVAIREKVSADLLAAFNIPFTQSFDCLPLFVANRQRKSTPKHDDVAVIASSIAWMKESIPDLQRFISALTGEGFKVRILVGAKAYHARDEQTFVKALEATGGGDWELFNAPSAEAWLDAIAEARILISGRFHHSVAAACLGTPFVTLNSNTPKIEGLMRTLGLDPPLAHTSANLYAELMQRSRTILDTPSKNISPLTSLDNLVKLSLRNFDGL